MNRVIGWFASAIAFALCMISLALTTAGVLSAGGPFERTTHVITFGLADDPPGAGVWTSLMDLHGTTFGIKTPMFTILVLAALMFFSIWRAQSNFKRSR